MPDATRAVLKNLSINDIENLGLQSMVVNTYHLYLQPGTELITKYKGVNNFMNWQKPLLSDSGGFQVFSLIHKNSQMGKIDNKGVTFKSPIDGSKHYIDSEKSIQIQFDLGVDMMVVFDDCPPNDYDEKLVNESVERTIEWAKRCRKEFDSQIKKRKMTSVTRPILFGVIQGGLSKELRKKCADALVEIGFDGFGFGARPVDKDGNFLDDILEFTADCVPENNLRFGLGIGTPEDIIRCVKIGWDMFDCVIPTREGRHGRLFMKTYDTEIKDYKNFYRSININNAQFKDDSSVINSESNLPELRNYTFAYLNHLFKIKDPLATRLASLNNLEFYLNLMKDIRNNIKNGNL